MKISAIVAVSKGNVIGKDNGIPWYLPADFKYFKKVTIGHHILMGRKCFESIGKPLPKRTNIVITRNPFFIGSGLVIFNSIEEGIEEARRNGEDELFIIGGGIIYEQTMHLLDKLYLTEVDLDVDGDVFFPDIKSEEWDLVSSEHHSSDEKNEHAYTFKVFERKT
jgi:dihydrofolate reductase